ncbi:acetyl-coenzyme A synthetase, partial [Helicobacter pylori]|nr:acetyl-coenzyme A synthetase [Helicobacter pylori]
AKCNLGESLELLKEMNHILSVEIGKIAKLDNVMYVPGLPKTRSGKIMRRLLKSIAKKEPITQDLSTLEDVNVVKEIMSIVQMEE